VSGVTVHNKSETKAWRMKRPTSRRLGTALARDDGMLYESPALGETERLRKINDGIINSQAEQAVFKIHDSASEWRGR
jgi:hypothetical protein